MELVEIEQFLEENIQGCYYEIESDYTEEELEKWNKVEFLDFERQAWDRKYKLKNK